MGERKKFDKAVYAFAKRPESSRSQANRELLKTIIKIHKENHKIYGVPQITKNLPHHQKASRGRVARLMKANGYDQKSPRNIRLQPIQSIISR